MKTCHDIFKHGNMLAGNYVIDPDGDGPLQPYNTYCDGAGKSIIGKDTRLYMSQRHGPFWLLLSDYFRCVDSMQHILGNFEGFYEC